MKKRYWRDAGWFAGGTFFGGWILSFILGIVKKVGG